MEAIVVENFGGPDALIIKDVPTPEPKDGYAVIQVKAFGVNRAEMYMRRGEWAEAMPIIGIECVGLVVACPSGEFAPGTPVAAVMGGLGRTINGSYAQYTRAPVSTVVALGDDAAAALPWTQLAAIPESYCTAWTCLFGNLELKAGQTLLIRGATSALGKAAINLAVQAGAKVSATTRKQERFDSLRKLGVKEVLLEAPELSARLEGRKFDAVLELVGNSTLVDSLKLVHRGGRLCLAGFLGGLAPVPEFNPLLQMASGVHFSFFGSFHFGTPEFPLSDVPLHSIVRMVAEKKFGAEPARVFKFEEIGDAHRAMEASEANGKMVVCVD
ncbi:alcohol dehydrogenase zinc-binding domain protein [Glonium stellatum]|uniref:Alcohol dehydrogenase zinc-binding domain protein n=1 Tax=Glonium stellatum TaxID=574774 RepID=A0A8E2JVY8_9PEZI|nr:alcohol dehydrogenase zinc-binding domain protein [Glonium stellatum]